MAPQGSARSPEQIKLDAEALILPTTDEDQAGPYEFIVDGNARGGKIWVDEPEATALVELSGWLRDLAEFSPVTLSSKYLTNLDAEIHSKLAQPAKGQRRG